MKSMPENMKRKVILPLTIPDDCIIEILLRLPVRSLLRFKCVCKSWFSFISDPQFAKSHFDLASTPTHRLLLRFSDNIVNSIDIDTPLHDDSAEVIFNIPPPSPAPKYGCRVDIVGSCRGFLLLRNVYYDFFYFVIWNPSTGFHKRISNVHAHLFSIGINTSIGDYVSRLFGIGYDSSTDDYVVVIVTLPLLGPRRSGRRCTEIYCFSLRTNSWSFIEVNVPYRIWVEFSHGLLLNGSLHWLIESYYNVGVIIAFDVMERRLSEIPLFHDLFTNGLASKTCDLKVMGGCLCLSIMDSITTMLEIWTMKDYKVKSSWTKTFVLSTICCYPLLCPLFPICITKNGEILGSNGLKALVRLDAKGKLLEYRECERKLIRSVCVMYKESLLSLPEDSEQPSL